MSPKNEAADTLVAKKLGISADAFFRVVDQWNSDPHGVIIRELQADRIQRLIDEKMQTFKTVSKDDLPKLQGEVIALELAKEMVAKRIE